MIPGWPLWGNYLKKTVGKVGGRTRRQKDRETETDKLLEKKSFAILKGKLTELLGGWHFEWISGSLNLLNNLRYPHGNCEETTLLNCALTFMKRHSWDGIQLQNCNLLTLRILFQIEFSGHPTLWLHALRGPYQQGQVETRRFLLGGEEKKSRSELWLPGSRLPKTMMSDCLSCSHT